MVQRRKLPRQIIRLGVGGRCGGDQSDPRGRHRQRTQYCNRLQPGAGRAFYIVARGQLIGQEDRIEQALFGALRQVMIILNIGQR